MATMTDDTTRSVANRRTGGLVLALVSAGAFGLSGPLAKALIESGWSPAAAVTLRSLVAAAVLLGPALHVLQGRWHLLRQNARLLVFYGIVPVAGTQLAYFTAVSHMQVASALLIEYVAPVAVVGWLWLRHGQRPTSLTVGGGLLCLAGLVLVLNLVSGTQLSVVGTVSALLAMVGCAVYFVVNASTDNGLPPMVLAAGGLLVGGFTLLVAGGLGHPSSHVTAATVTLGGSDLPWWVPVLLLGTVTAALAYVTGIEASRRLGSRLSSFVALVEVLASLAWSWWLVGQVLLAVQWWGAVLVLAGVVVVNLGEPRAESDTMSA
jgi:drug/metabolite transporter (DMT)-like permease